MRKDWWASEEHDDCEEGEEHDGWVDDCIWDWEEDSEDDDVEEF